MSYNSLLDFDVSYLPLGFWDYNPEWDVSPDEVLEALDTGEEVCYNEGVEEDNERKIV